VKIDLQESEDVIDHEIMGTIRSRFSKITRHKYLDILLVFSVVLAFGTLLLISASDAQDTQNQVPVITGFTASPPSPQLAGTVVTWTASAEDPDRDQIYYQFSLNGPSTGGSWMSVTPWIADGSWSWSTSDSDVGDSQVRVRVRDGNHAGEDSSDDERTDGYTISAPAAAEPEPQAPPASTTVETTTPQETATQAEEQQQTEQQQIEEPSVVQSPFAQQTEQQTEQQQIEEPPVVNRHLHSRLSNRLNSNR
jgi:hypothetical protein